MAKRKDLNELSPAYRKRLERAASKGVTDRALQRGHASERPLSVNANIPTTKPIIYKSKSRTLLNKLAGVGLNNAEISDKTGIPVEQVEQLRKGETKLDRSEGLKLVYRTNRIHLDTDQTARILSIKHTELLKRANIVDAKEFIFWRDSGIIQVIDANNQKYLAIRFINKYGNIGPLTFVREDSALKLINETRLEDADESEEDYPEVVFNFGIAVDLYNREL